jgi:hypothetical protein
MALTKTAVTVLASTSVAAGTLKTAPVAGSTINLTQSGTPAYGGELTYKITNGTAPGVALSLTFQVSQDGTNWYDYYTIAGDTTVSSINSGAVQLDRGVMYLRAIAYGNTTNAVTVESYLQAVTAL